MAGVPSAYLSPRIPPPNVGYNVSVGVEIAPGLGISLDGKALLVGPGGHQGRTDILGHLPDGSYKSRDSVVLSSDSETRVDGYHAWQDYSLYGSAEEFSAQGDSALRSFTVNPTDSGFEVKSEYSARTWTVSQDANSISVVSDYDDGERFVVSTQDGVTTVDSNFEGQDFTLTKQEDESVFIDGKLTTQDFTFKATDSGYDLKGHFPQQHFRVNKS